MSLKEFKQIEQPEIKSLVNIANSEGQMKFLAVLSNSQQFIEWLQEETNGNYITTKNEHKVVVNMNYYHIL